MPDQPYLLCYFIDLEPNAPTGDQMHIVYQLNREEFRPWDWTWPFGSRGAVSPLISGPGGYWEQLIRSGPWWDGTRPQFILPLCTWLPMNHDVMLRILAHWYGLECIQIAITIKDYEAGGCVVLVQRADNPNPNHWRVWHTPITDKWKVFQTAPNDWTARGWYDHNDWTDRGWFTSAPVPRSSRWGHWIELWNQVTERANAKAKAKAKAKAQPRSSDDLSTCLPSDDSEQYSSESSDIS